MSFLHLLFLSFLQLKIIDMPKRHILEWHVLIPFTSYWLKPEKFCLIIHLMTFKECFSKNDLGICIKMIRDTDSRVLGLLQTSLIGISGVGPESTCLTSFQAILRFFVSFVDQAVLMHSEEWLELCGSLLSMMCVWQSSL